jgi:signal transduction histidine kinase
VQPAQYRIGFLKSFFEPLAPRIMNPSDYPSKNLLLGKKGQHLSYSAFKLALLTGFLSVLTFLIDTGYIAFDLYHKVYYSWPLLSLSAFLSLTSFILNRVGYYFPAKLTLGLSVNISIFIFSSIEPIETGLSFLFIICALGAISTLGIEQKKLAFVFVLLPIVLFIFSVVVDVGLFTRRSFDPEYVRVNMIINFFSTFAAAILIIYFLLSLNHHSESALRENEKRLHEKNEELVKVNKELDRFVYSASHDLRSPISSVRGLINLVKLTTIPPETKSYVDMMDKKLISLNKFIEDIVLYSRNTRVGISTETIKLKELVDDSLMNLQYYPGSEKVDVQVNIPDHLTLVSDPTRLRIVLANLLSNAFKYSNPVIENPYIIISASITTTGIELSIRDNGTGIDEQFLPKIFDMFFQANDKSEGSGLGLYIVKETLEKIQGDIRVQSELRNGTEFIVMLPKEITDAQLT